MSQEQENYYAQYPQFVEDDYVANQGNRFSIPHYLLVQNGSMMPGKDGNVGKFYNPSTRTFVGAVAMYIVDFFDTRAMRQTGKTRDPYMCHSKNGKQPLPQYVGQHLVKLADAQKDKPQVDGVIPEWCDLCPFKFGGCDDRMTYRAIDAMTFMPFYFQISRSKWDAAKALNTQIFMHGLRQKTLPLYQMTSAKGDSSEYDYRVPVFSEITVENDLYENYEEIVQLAADLRANGLFPDRHVPQVPAEVKEQAAQIEATRRGLENELGMPSDYMDEDEPELYE